MGCGRIIYTHHIKKPKRKLNFDGLKCWVRVTDFSYFNIGTTRLSIGYT